MSRSRAGSNQSEVSMPEACARAAWSCTANYARVDRMAVNMNGMADDVDRRIGARSFARMLGDWRPPGGRGLTAALADRVRLLVLDGRLPLQMRVPAERELASALDVSRTTVAAAYEALRE